MSSRIIIGSESESSSMWVAVPGVLIN